MPGLSLMNHTKLENKGSLQIQKWRSEAMNPHPYIMPIPEVR